MILVSEVGDKTFFVAAVCLPSQLFSGILIRSSFLLLLLPAHGYEILKAACLNRIVRCAVGKQIFTPFPFFVVFIPAS